MAVPAKFFASPMLLDMVVSEAQASSSGSGGFVASLQQLSNVATLPGIVGKVTRLSVLAVPYCLRGGTGNAWQPLCSECRQIRLGC